jgi:hypothetical protein
MLRGLLTIALLFATRAQLPINDLPPGLRKQATEVETIRQLYPENPCVLYQAAVILAKAGRTN